VMPILTIASRPFNIVDRRCVLQTPSAASSLFHGLAHCPPDHDHHWNILT
jgi:hypothetical protein